MYECVDIYFKVDFKKIKSLYFSNYNVLIIVFFMLICLEILEIVILEI